MKISKRQLRRIIREAILEEDKSGKGACPDTGCIKKSGDKWRIISNKTGKMWPQKYETKEIAPKSLKQKAQRNNEYKQKARDAISKARRNSI